jgi:hypothetical protein
VSRILLGSTGNGREDDYDLRNVSVLLTHTTRANHALSMYEIQELTCTASAGTFTLTFGVDEAGVAQTTQPIAWDADAATLLQALTHINGTLADITITMNGAQSTVCVPDGALPVTLTMPASFGDAPEIVADDSGLTSIYRVNHPDSRMHDGDAIKIQETVKGGVTVVYRGGLTGQYDVTYVPQVKGHYSLRVTIEGRDIDTDLSNGVNVLPAVTSGPHSSHTARPFAMEGVSETFIIQARDRFLNELDSEPNLAVSGPMSVFEASLVGVPDYRAGQHPVRIADGATASISSTITSVTRPNSDGRFLVRYEPVVAGDYMLAVTWQSSGGLVARYYINQDFSGMSPGGAPDCPLDSYTVVGSRPSLLTQTRWEVGYAEGH